MRRRTALVLPALCITLSCVGRVQVDAPKPQASTPTAQDTAADVATDVTIEVNGRNVTVDGVQVAFLPNFGDGIDVAAFDTLALRLQEKSGGESPRSSPGSIRIKLWDGATVAQADVVVQAAVWQGYPNVTVDVAGKSRQFRAPSLAPAGAQSIQTQPKESVYVARVPAGIELTWLRQYRGGDPEILDQVTVADSPNALATTLRKKCGGARPCNNVVVEVARTAPFLDVFNVLLALDAVSVRPGGPVLVFGEWRRNRKGNPNHVVGPIKEGGTLPPAAIQKRVRSRYDAFRRCYEQGLARDPKLEGRVVVRFVIDRDGKVSGATVEDSTDLPDEDVVNCLVGVYSTLVFPAPRGGMVTVVYPIMFSPG